jgi:hypothetical protein
MLGYNFVIAVPLTMKDVVVAGPHNAPADVFRKNSANLVLEGTNTGTGAAGALEIETTPYRSGPMRIVSSGERPDVPRPVRAPQDR